MEDVDTVFPYDAYVLGSAVYVGGWLRSANHFVDEHAELISTRPTWLFSSGPIGDRTHRSREEFFDAVDLVDRTRARDHRQFGGKLDKEHLSLRRACRGRVAAGARRRLPGVGCDHGLGNGDRALTHGGSARLVFERCR